MQKPRTCHPERDAEHSGSSNKRLPVAIAPLLMRSESRDLGTDLTTNRNLMRRFLDALRLLEMTTSLYFQYNELLKNQKCVGGGMLYSVVTWYTSV